MVEYILGNYLVDTGKITREQLAAVMDEVDSVKVKLDLMAVTAGMMTAAQADEVNILRSVMDKDFGELAREEGYLTEEQLLKLQKQPVGAYLTFVQCLLDAGLIEMEELDWLLDDFKRVNNYSNAELEDIRSDDAERILALRIPEEAREYLPLIAETVRCMIRMVDRHIYVGAAAMVDSLPTEGMIAQEMDGYDGGLVTCFGERDGALLQLCRSYGQEHFEVLDVDALDAAGELLNCANGRYASEMSREGRVLELLSPVYTYAEPVRNICRIPIFIGNKGLYFAVSRRDR